MAEQLDPAVSDVVYYIDSALDGMVEILTCLGDDASNHSPELLGANSAYAILNHCIGVMEFWGGQIIAGRTIDRDRPAEFLASGPVAPLVLRVARAREKLRDDLSRRRFGMPVSETPVRADYLPGPPLTVGGTLLHVLQELAQHLGQMELTRDVLTQARSSQAPQPPA